MLRRERETKESRMVDLLWDRSECSLLVTRVNQFEILAKSSDFSCCLVKKILC